ncbi:MAG: pyridoxamine 5'-phosphate oxidase [Phycisphaerales bacterium]|nr:pyridoxamine 5'-phosphate oxidase [Phycisphaerales bacterium]
MIDEPDLAFEIIPADPCALLGQWLEHAREQSAQPNWNVIYLATVDGHGRPGVRPVLQKYYDAMTGRITFFTNYHSRKARDIEACPNVSAAMHWDHLERVVRVDGAVEKASEEVSNRYFATRSRESQLGAWASDQSADLPDWETLLERVFEASSRFAGGPVPRPPHWGGYVLTPQSIEFWAGRESRIHERVLYVKDDGRWVSRRLYP